MGIVHPSKISGKDVQCTFVLITDINSSIYIPLGMQKTFLLLRKVLF